jgi:hypothetical protein
MKSYDQIDEFSKLLLQTNKLLNDFLELSKKKPNDAVNKFKLKIVNNLLSTANKILTKKYIPFEGFDLFDEDDLPTNSDVVVILDQYVACLKKFGRDSTEYEDYRHYWVINGKRCNISADWNMLKEPVKK